MKKRLCSMLVAIAMLIATVMVMPMGAFALESTTATLTGPGTVKAGASVTVTVASVTNFDLSDAYKFQWSIELPNGETDNRSTTTGSINLCYNDEGLYKVRLMAVYVTAHPDNEEYASSAVHDFYVEKPTPSPSPAPQQEEQKPATEEQEPQFVEDTYVPDVVAKDSTQFTKDSSVVVPAGSYNFSAYSTPAGFAKGVEKIADKRDASGNVYVFSGKPLTINRALLNTLTAKKTSLIYYFNHDGHLYSVIIPAGVDPNLVLDANGHSGPLNVGWLMGTARLIR